MKKPLACLLAALMSVTVFAGCGTDDSANSSSPTSSATSSTSSAETSSEPSGDAATDPALEQIKSSGQLVVLTNAQFPPFEYIDGTVPAGVDIDIADEIAKDLSEALGTEITVKVDDIEFDSIIPSLVSGKGQIALAGMTITEDRKASVDFSVEYITSTQYIIQKTGAGMQTLEDLKGKKIGAQLGTTGDLLISDEIEGGSLKDSGASINQYKSGLEAAMDLQNGRLDAVVIDEFTAKAIAGQIDGLEVSQSAISDSESYAAAVAQGNEALLGIVNKTLERLIADGSIEEMVTAHTTAAKE